MNDNLKRFIGQYITVLYRFNFENEWYEEYVQGILRKIDSNIVIDQYLDYYSLVCKEKELPKKTRLFEISQVKFISTMKVN